MSKTIAVLSGKTFEKALQEVRYFAKKRGSRYYSLQVSACSRAPDSSDVFIYLDTTVNTFNATFNQAKAEIERLIALHGRLP